MTREQYIRMTEATRRAADRLPGGARALRAPTLLCAAIYCASLLYLMFTGDGRIVRAVLVPAACFAVVTALRPLLGKQRPYDRYGAPPVGAYSPGKGKSMPSRHTASAAAIARIDARVAKLVIARALLRVGEHRVGLVDLFKLFLRLGRLVSLVHIRVIFFCQLAIRFFYLCF